MKPRDFVASYDLHIPKSVYTVVPVIERRILDLPYHLKRLWQNQMLLYDESEVPLGSELDLKEVIVESTLNVFKVSTISRNGLLTICVGECQKGKKFEASALFYPQPPNFLLNSATQRAVVDVQYYERKSDPRIKACGWPEERKHLELLRQLTTTESIMCSASADGGKGLELTEGLTSNFFVIENEVLVTAAEDKVLSGSMARLVMIYAKSLGIPVERRSPTLHAKGPQRPCAWTSAFLTSAAKPMVSIERVLGSNGDVLFDADSLLRQSSSTCEVYESVRNALHSALRDPHAMLPAGYQGTGTGTGGVSGWRGGDTDKVKDNKHCGVGHNVDLSYPLWSEQLDETTSIERLRDMLRGYLSG